MLDTLKQAGKHISRSLGRTWDNISEGWRELVHHSSDALTHFSRREDQGKEKQHPANAFPVFRNWSLLAGDVEETDKEIVVRMEAPGMEKKDCEITIDGNILYVRGEKRFERARRRTALTTSWSAPTAALSEQFLCRATSIRRKQKLATRTAY
jgi:HSP20 family protein